MFYVICLVLNTAIAWNKNVYLLFMPNKPLYGLMQATVAPSDEWKCILWLYT